jgi:hypothetical protein
VLSHFGIEKPYQDIMAELPMKLRPNSTKKTGTLNQDLAIYMLKLGLSVEIVSYDTWITDLSWQGKDGAHMKIRLQAELGTLDVAMMDRSVTDAYIQGYIDFLEAGGHLSIQPYPATSYIKSALRDGPIMTSVLYGTLHGNGKSVTRKHQRPMDFSDTNGESLVHDIVISQFINDCFEIYDPLGMNGGVCLIEPDNLVAAISAAQQQCDNMLIIARRP